MGHSRAVTFSRRSFLGWLASLLGVGGVTFLGYRESKHWRERTRSRAGDAGSPAVARGLSADAVALVAAVSTRLVPTTDLPGAREANVAEFIDRQMADKQFRVFRDEIEAGAKRYADFAALSPEKQVERLTGIQSDETHLFQVLLTLTLEGAFADPRHGGNRDCAGWKLLGIDRHECKHT
ncbi:MAG: gluconate 2-dehydrogenase subunit 3 family protein [Deltaproteobacteria bacterium]|nr:gluconate 2-dehydrogenase subunit 3 family protein [Deltaproteobacteria bacterium]